MLEEMEIEPGYRNAAMEYTLKYALGFKDSFDPKETLTLDELADLTTILFVR